MAHDVFISYSSKDKPIADAVCGTLEGKKIRCWIAPRDLLPGLHYGEAIVEAIEASRVMVLVFSSSANSSAQVIREVERAVSKDIPIIPLRIEQVAPSKSLEYFISAPHWLDALTPPLEKHLLFLAETVYLFFSRHDERCYSRENKSGPNSAGDAAPTVTNSIGMKLALVKPGAFLMGSPASEEHRSDNEYQHEVEITRSFYAGVYEVAQEQYHRVMGANPSWFSSTGSGKDKVKGIDTRQFPVECVSWEDAVDFCLRLSALPEEKANGRVYRLPTEAEWEYICRNGPFIKKPPSPFYFGNSLSSKQANFNGKYPYGSAAKGGYLRRTTKVGSYPANLLGLYDLHGNVLEWCIDWYDAEYYQRSPRQNPQGPENGERRVLRGGSWNYSGRNCRAAYRDSYAPGDRILHIGFRVVLLIGAGK